MKPGRTAKAKTSADQADDRLVYDRPVTLRQYDLTQHIWQDAQHLHANINKAISTGGQAPADSAHTVRLVFRFRYFAALGGIRESLQHYRIVFDGKTYEISDYDDYNERHSIIKLTASSVRAGTVSLISETIAADAIGQQVATETTADYPCSEYEITESERVDLHQIGLRPVIRLRIFRDEYSGQRRATYLNHRYRIGTVRYVGDCVDLYLEEKVGDLSGS